MLTSRDDDVLAGRDHELGLLTGLLTTGHRRPAVGVLEGPPGIGKSRLLAELRRTAAGSGRPVAPARARATGDGRPVPYGLLLDALWDAGARSLLEAFADQAEAGTGSGAGHGLGTGTGNADGPEHGHRQHRQLREALAGAPPVLLLDDVQWADRESLLLLDRLVASPPTGRFTVVLACRSGGCPPWLTRTLADADAVWIELAPLGPAAIARLVPGAAPERLRLLARASGGNPRYLRALTEPSAGPCTGPPPELPTELPTDLLAGLAAGDPRVLGPQPAAPATADWQPGPELRGELATLAERTRTVLRAAAVAGPEFDPALVAAVAELPTGAVAGALDELAGHGLLAPAGGRHRFTRPLPAAALYRLAGSAWRAGAHRRAADHLDRCGAPLAEWAGQAAYATPGADRELLARLTAAARTVLDPEPVTSARWLRAVLAALPERADCAELRTETTLLLGRALTLTGRLDEATAALGPLLSGPAPDRERAAGPVALAERLRGRTDRVYGLLERDGGGRVRDQLQLARLDVMNGRTERSLHRIEAAVRRDDSAGTRLTAHGLTSLAAIGQGAVPAARRALDAAERLADSLDARGQLRALAALPELGWAGVLLERRQRTAERIERGIALAERHQHHYVIPQLHAVRAALLLMSGPLDAARAAADRALELARELGATETLAIAAALRLRALAWQGGPAAAGPALELLLGLPEPPTAVWRAVVRHAVVEASVVCGQPPSAAEAARLLNLGDGRWRDPMPAHGHDLMAAVHAAEGNTALVARHVELAGRAARSAGLPAAGAVVSLASARLLRVRGEQDRATALARRAADGLAASGFVVRAGMAQLVAAEIAAEHGDRSGYEGATDAARRLFGRAGAHALLARAELPWRAGRCAAEARGARTVPDAAVPPGRPAPPEGPSLSAREHEIADLTAQGLTNQAIAARLFLSVRTVESHLTSVYRKLGISGRAAVARALDPVRHG
ncbi:AAA family ATPase [Kitasatospora sp. NPDC059146]|uniref:helix-turn-helix transcriptional regulator n=1 Tax=unclassified Kitasatospora TaxID=2633591 RepID=UPI0036BF7B7B